MLWGGPTAATDYSCTTVTRQRCIMAHQFGGAVIADIAISVFRDSGVSFSNDGNVIVRQEKAQNSADHIR